MARLSEQAVREFGAKLRLTSAALGCDGQKALATAFRRANPDTAFELARSYRWMQDRALPRSRRVYEEWAALVAPDRSSAWLLGCELDEFAALLAARHGTDAASLRSRAGLDVPRFAGAEGSATAARDVGEPAFGTYACYSHAQSPYFRGRVIRGTLSISPGPRRSGAMAATYSQALPTGRARATGQARLHGTALCAALEVATPGVAPVCLSVFGPTPPASVLAGFMLGVTAVSPGLQPPYATRFAALRVPGPVEEVEASNRYLEPAEWPPGRDLAALGLPASAERDALLAAFLAGNAAVGSDNADTAAHLALVTACDRAWLTRIPAAA